MFNGCSRSVSRVPGAPPRCETPPVAPGPSTRITVHPVGRSASVWWPTLSPSTVVSVAFVPPEAELCALAAATSREVAAAAMIAYRIVPPSKDLYHFTSSRQDRRTVLSPTDPPEDPHVIARLRSRHLCRSHHSWFFISRTRAGHRLDRRRRPRFERRGAAGRHRHRARTCASARKRVGGDDARRCLPRAARSAGNLRGRRRAPRVLAADAPQCRGRP